MSKTAVVTWTDPTKKFTGVEVAQRLASAPDFTVVSTVVPGVQTLSIPDLPAGDYEFRLIALNGNLRSDGVVITGSFTEETAPDDVVNAAVTFA